MKNNKFYLGAFSLLIFLATGCIIAEADGASPRALHEREGTTTGGPNGDGNNTKSDCYFTCDEGANTYAEEIDCKIVCSELHKNNSLCLAAFQEGGEKGRDGLCGYKWPPTSHDPGAFLEEYHTALLAIEKVTLCQTGESASCGSTCEDVTNIFHCHQ